MKNRHFLVVLSIAAAAAAGCTGFERESSTDVADGRGQQLAAGILDLIVDHPVAEHLHQLRVDRGRTDRDVRERILQRDVRGRPQADRHGEGGFANPTTIAWTASGNATAPGLTSCSIAIGGSATVGTESISIPYSGTTCLGPVSGIESIRKRGI